MNVTDATTNEPVQNGTVNIYVNDTLVGTGEVVNGSVIIPINIKDVGPGEINITYVGNDEYAPSSEIEDVQIEPREVTLVVEEGNNTVDNTTVDIELTDTATGEPITDAPIEIINNGTVIATGTTDEDGKLTIPIDLPAGNYVIDIVHENDNPYENKTVQLPLTINKLNATIVPTVKNNSVANTTIEVKVTDKDTGKEIVNATTELTLENGTKVQAVTDSEGIATYNVNIPAGENILEVKLVETPIYNEAISNVTVDVEKLAVIVTVDEVHGIYGEKVILRAHVTDLDGNLVSGGRLVFKINGVTITKGLVFETDDTTVYKIAVNNGIVEIELPASAKLRRAVNISATYSGSSIYRGNRSNVADINMQLRTAAINVVTAEYAKQDSDITFTAIISDITENSTNSYVNGGHVQFKINGLTLRNEDDTPISVAVVNNMARYTYHIPKGTSAITNDGLIKNYTVTASYDNKAYYHGVKNNTTYHVDPYKVEVTFKEVKVQDNLLSIKADMKDDDGYYISGRNKVAIKINGKTYQENGKVKYFNIQNGKVDLSGINTNGTIVKEVTLVSGARDAYLGVRATTTNIVVA